jgi:hypothetical protein
MNGVDGKMFVLGPLKLLIVCSIGMKDDVDERKLVFVKVGNSEFGMVGRQVGVGGRKFILDKREKIGCICRIVGRVEIKVWVDVGKPPKKFISFQMPGFNNVVVFIRIVRYFRDRIFCWKHWCVRRKFWFWCF